MNTKDFVVLPWGKSGNSVKLRYKHAQELRMEKVQLELENEEMEKKLKEFRFARSKEKEEMGSNGYHWTSGKVGKLSHQSHTMLQSKGNPVKFSSQNLRFKFLKEQTQASVKQPFNSKMANSLRSEKSKTKGRVCGQCENKAALLVCLECGEDYCSGCFAKIHQKGALKLHRTTLLQAKSQILSSVLEAAHQFIKEAALENTAIGESPGGRQEPRAPVHRGSSAVDVAVGKRTECTSPGEKLLLEGSFSEAASAQSFQEALRQWRAGSHEEERQNLPKADSLEECEVQTTLKIWREPLHIEFKEDSLSYMEKLWLKKHRRTPPERRLSMVPGTFTALCATSGEVQCPQMENDEDGDEELNIESPEPSLKIVELDKTYEEDFGDPGSIVPYKVELADADYHQCCTFDEYQKNSFPCENVIYRHVFNKGQMAHLHLCLTNSFTHCKDDVTAGPPHSDLDNMVDPSAYCPDADHIEECSTSERNVKEKGVDAESNQNSDYYCISLEHEDSLESLDSEKPSIDEKVTQGVKESLGFSNLPKWPDFEDSKTAHSLLWLQDIALRSKPIIEKYQGLERFFIFDTNEKVNSPSHSLAGTRSTHRNTFAGDREWIPSHSLSTHADHAVALGVFRTVQKLSIGRPQNTAQKSQRPSSANLPLSSSVKRGSRCLPASPFPSRTAAQSQSTTAAQVSETEDLANADQNEPFLDDTADQQAIASLEKELNVLRNPADPSEECYSLASEGLPASDIPSLTPSQTSRGFVTPSPVRAPCGVEQLSSSGKYTEIPSTLALSESSTDEEEEFLDKQQVIVLP
ncbi:zinc finger B-box domain-containing protein 1 isoform X1 [Ochotona princeps]|uniref:zinc finger B-box domain-containing protein 1 isoform X1 n=1 Tax=Ochotona princeps TaxID=9978 RepID=UPI00271486B1|nr:zinc finger B-box domain-containing protein 1 isoform X1 [Ochotona princeps]